ncbi:ABC transporter ATP-binding protein [Mesorhizobium sp. KR1-2]|uniref:ABC transporter ATP-binding protein n=1 Tax=Mesorhizobium sp. KR1-2 TaxID=3156609 RepID=UPI0032B3DBCF
MTLGHSDTLVSITDLNRTFTGGRRLLRKSRTMNAVSNVSLQIERGSVTGVVGESGCGKSTLARLALRLIEPTSGRVMFDGIDIGTLTPKAMRSMRRRMQMVFQDPYSAIDPRYRLQDALLEPFRLQGVKLTKAEASAKVEELLTMVGLRPELARSYPHQLSGGQKQRAGIARALALQPEFLVLDEPTASLDVSIQAQIIGLLERLKDELGLTYLFISHDLGLVRYFSDRIVVMYLGRVVELLPTPTALPRHPYTKALLDSTFEPDPKLRRAVAPAEGEIPSAFDLPPGCAYASRCPFAQERCRTERPELQSRPHHSLGNADGNMPPYEHPVACHFPLSLTSI